MNIPKEFVDHVKTIIGSEVNELLLALHEKPNAAIRLNPNKPEHALSLGKPVPWCRNGYYLPERPVFTLDPYFHAGHYYPQEPSSMQIATILDHLDLPKEPLVLDLCAAPGGKTTVLLDKLPHAPLIHAHESVASRAEILRQNIEKWGNTNTLITQGSAETFKSQSIKYDLILVDAPCSGEGMFRKEKAAITQWSKHKISHCAAIQDQLLQIAYDACALGGYIIYCTCTYNLWENEERIKNLQSRNEIETCPLSHTHPGVIFTYLKNIPTYRCMPHKIDGEGLSFTVIRKVGRSSSYRENKQINRKNTKNLKIRATADWLDPRFKDSHDNTLIGNSIYLVPQNHRALYNEITAHHRTIHAGIPFGKYRGSDFYPAHGLCLNLAMNSNLPSAEVSRSHALDLLRGLSQGKTDLPDKWLYVRYKQARLMWVKNINGHLKNYVPKNQKIFSL